MTEQAFIKSGKHLIRLEAVAGAKWSKDKLYVFLLGGNYIDLQHAEADRLWESLIAHARDLDDEGYAWKKVNDGN